MFCNKCGTQLPDAAEFCFACGAKVISAEKQNKEVKGELEEAISNSRKENTNKKIGLLVLLIFLSAAVIVSGVFLYLNFVEKQIDSQPAEIESNEAVNEESEQTETFIKFAEASAEDFCGEWILAGRLDSLESELIEMDDVYYINIDDKYVNLGKYSADENVLESVTKYNYNYLESAGQDNINCLMSYPEEFLLALDTSGNLIQLRPMEEQGEYTEIYLYKKAYEGAIENFFYEKFYSEDTEDLYGIWVEVGTKDKDSDLYNSPADVDSDLNTFSFNYLEIDHIRINHIYFFTQLLAHYPQYEFMYMYDDSAGGDEKHLICMDQPFEYMLDKDGYLIEINDYNMKFKVFEKASQNTVDAFYASIKDKYLKNEFKYNTDGQDHTEYLDVGQWHFKGFAENPYTEIEYNLENMLDFVNIPKYEWNSYFNFIYGNDSIDYYSTTTGETTLNYNYNYEKEYGGYYFNADSQWGNDSVLLNMFYGDDNRMYVCFAQDNDAHTCLSHFYVYERCIPYDLLETINIHANQEDFAGLWELMGSKYYYEDNLEQSSYEYYIINITEQGTMQHFIKNGYLPYENFPDAYEYSFSNFYISQSPAPGSYTRYMYFIDNDGNLVRVDYSLAVARTKMTVPNCYYFSAYDGTVPEFRETHGY